MFAGDRDRSRIHNPCATITVSFNAHYAGRGRRWPIPARREMRGFLRFGFSRILHDCCVTTVTLSASDMPALVDGGKDRIGKDAQRLFVVVQQTVTVGVIDVAVTVGMGSGQPVRRQEQRHDCHVCVVRDPESRSTAANVHDLCSQTCLREIRAGGPLPSSVRNRRAGGPEENQEFADLSSNGPASPGAPGSAAFSPDFAGEGTCCRVSVRSIRVPDEHLAAAGGVVCHGNQSSTVVREFQCMDVA